MEEHSFGYWLRLRRKALDLTQDGLADRVGCSVALIRKIESEERRPSAQIVERLAEIFDIPPDEQEKFLRYARGDWNSAPVDLTEELPWRVPANPSRSSLPATTSSLIGREKELGELHEYLMADDIRLVTLMGPPGIGKTRLSIEAARAGLQGFPNGVFFVLLAPLEDPNSIASAVTQTLGYVGAKNISTTEQLKEGIREKRLLLVLDNCEHLINAVASLTSDLLSACPNLKILATSRESLRIPGEWLYAVPAFDLPTESFSLDVESASNYPSLTLFAERARAVRSDFSLNTDNIETIAAICARLDGLPLAIELIAARMRLMSPQALLDRLSAQFVLTADGMRAASERQKTLHNAIDWSYSLLPAEEQTLFTYLSVFSGGFKLEAVETMFSQRVTEKPIPTLISLLLDKSLLKLAPDLKGSRDARYSMLVTIQDYARERLQEMGKETEIRNVHLAYFLNVAEKAGKELRGPDELAWLRHLDSDRDNLRTALDWAIETGQTEAALHMVRKLDWFWFIRSDHNEGRQWLERVLKLPNTPMYHEAHAEALYDIAHHIWLQVGHIETRPYVEQALSIARIHSDKHNIARALSILGLVLADEKNFTEAQTALEESMALYQEVGDEWGYTHALTCLGHVWQVQGNLQTAVSLREQALASFRKLGDRYFQSATLNFLGSLQAEQGNLERGMAELRESLILAQQLDSKYEIAMTLWSFAEVSQTEGNQQRAVHLYLAAKNSYDSIGAWTKEHDLKFEDYLIPGRAALGESAFEEAVEKGHAMTMEQAIAYALEETL